MRRAALVVAAMLATGCVPSETAIVRSPTASPSVNSDLSQHRVIVREGVVWVRYLEASLLTPSVRDEAAER